MIKNGELPKLKITNEIYRRILITRKSDGKKSVKLIKTDGFKTKWLGREVGLYNEHGIWFVTDLKTGLKMPVPQYKRRGFLLNYMANRKNNQNLRMAFATHEEVMKKREEEFKKLKQLYNLNQKKGVEKK